MLPKIVCRKCGGELAPSDTFCSACGSSVQWHDEQREKTPNADSLTRDISRQESLVCSLCGNKNSLDSTSCTSCGAALSSHLTSQSSMTSTSTPPSSISSTRTPLKMIQSWKLTAALGVVLIATLITTRMMHQDAATGLPPEHAALVKEIQVLEKQLEGNPTNAQALLQLGNLYYDRKLFPRAIMMYDRYLQINPSNSDARVDLGTSYFQLALSDSLRRSEYFASAKDEIEKALQYTPEHQLACYNLGMVSLHTGEIEKANEWFKKCATIDSNSEVGKRAQQLIKQHSLTQSPL